MSAGLEGCSCHETFLRHSDNGFQDTSFINPAVERSLGTCTLVNTFPHLSLLSYFLPVNASKISRSWYRPWNPSLDLSLLSTPPAMPLQIASYSPPPRTRETLILLVRCVAPKTATRLGPRWDNSLITSRLDGYTCKAWGYMTTRTVSQADRFGIRQWSCGVVDTANNGPKIALYCTFGIGPSR